MVDFINFGFVRQTTHLKVTNSGHFVFIKRLFLQKFLEVNKIIGDAVNVRISLFSCLKILWNVWTFPQTGAII